jgi:Collagen triple helix repeat (20 copies)
MLHKVNSVIPLLAFALLVPLHEAVSAAPAKSVCIKSDGSIQIRLRCKKNERTLTALELNNIISSSNGAAGPVGSEGPAGAEGPVGPTGPVGPAGPVGQSGPVGSAGVVGLKGSVGPTGASGAQGQQGIQGVKGPPGQLDLSGCRVTPSSFTSNFLSPANAVLYTEVYCNPTTEFLLEDDAVVAAFPGSEGTRSVIQWRLTYTQNVNGDIRDYGVGIYANRYLTVGQGILNLTVRGICCPR